MTERDALDAAIQQANELLEAGQALEALEALADVGERATDLQAWDVAIRAHRIAAEILHQFGEIGPALSHAAEGVYLCVEHRPEDTLESLGQVLAFVEQAVEERRYYVAEEVGPGMLQVLVTLKPAPGGEAWLELALDIARLIALVGEAHGDAESQAYIEALALSALLDRATKNKLKLNTWIRKTGLETRHHN